jgi:tripartite-type tricarboxylate transporter receptor subunit TctC
MLEKELGTSVQVVNKAGAGSQVGLAELAASKPDGTPSA